jgi:hypothetical protein
MKHTFAAVAALTLITSSSLVCAQDGDNEREYRHIARIQADRPEEALTRYQGLYEQSRSPRALAQIAGVEAQMSRWVAAEEHITAALASNDRWIERNRPSLSEMQRTIRAHVSDLMIVANVPGAALSVNGESRGTLPLSQPVRVVAGQVRVELSADGFEPLRQSIEATPGRARVELALLRSSLPAAPTPVTVAVTPVVVTTPAPAPSTVTLVTTPVVVDGNSGSILRPLGIASLALGAVGLGLGVAGVVISNGSVDSFNRGCSVVNGMVMGGGNCQSDYDSGNTMRALGTVGFIAGGVFTAAGIAMIVAAPRARPTETRAAFGCGWGPGTVGIGCGGHFW